MERERLQAIDRDRRAQHAIGRALLRLAGARRRLPPGPTIAITISDDGKPALR